MIEVIPSILSTTIQDAQHKLDRCEGQVSKVHLDIMDGNFVDNSSFPIELLTTLKTSAELRVHLMVRDPVAYAQQLVGKVQTLFIHEESVPALAPALSILHQHFHVGVVLRMETPARVLFSHLNHIDEVILMTVPLGHSGGTFHEEPLKKSLHLKALKPSLPIGVDGGVSVDTADIIKRYPIDFVTPGSSLFARDDFHAALLDLKKALSYD